MHTSDSSPSSTPDSLLTVREIAALSGMPESLVRDALWEAALSTPLTRQLTSEQMEARGMFNDHQ